MIRTILLFAVVSLVACSSPDPKTNNGNNNPNNSNNVNNTNNSNNGNNQNFFSCTQTLDCKLRPNGCCDSCQLWSLGNTIAINANAETDYLNSVCEDDDFCPECASQPNPNIVATCNTGTCEAVDLIMTEITECQIADDCEVRSGLCCECGGDQPGQVIGIAKGSEPDLVALVCDEEAVCLDCEPDYSIYTAVCNDGRCAAEILE